MDYDYPSVMSSDHENMEQKKLEQINSCIRNYEYASEDYDRRYGKGSYFKKFPETKAILDELYEVKIEGMNKKAKEMLKDAGDSE